MRTLALITLLCLSVSAHAQNDPIVGSAALGYLATSGNTETTNGNALFELDWDRGGVWTHQWTALAIGASTEDTTTSEAYAAGYKARREITEASYLFATGDWRKDRFSAYDRQLTEAVGYGR